MDSLNWDGGNVKTNEILYKIKDICYNCTTE